MLRPAPRAVHLVNLLLAGELLQARRCATSPPPADASTAIFALAIFEASYPLASPLLVASRWQRLHHLRAMNQSHCGENRDAR